MELIHSCSCSSIHGAIVITHSDQDKGGDMAGTTITPAYSLLCQQMAILCNQRHPIYKYPGHSCAQFSPFLCIFHSSLYVLCAPSNPAGLLSLCASQGRHCRVSCVIISPSCRHLNTICPSSTQHGSKPPWHFSKMCTLAKHSHSMQTNKITDWVNPNDKSGEFKRQQSVFRNWISRESGAQFPPEKGRYHLYVSYACPWGKCNVHPMLLKGN